MKVNEKFFEDLKEYLLEEGLDDDDGEESIDECIETLKSKPFGILQGVM